MSDLRGESVGGPETAPSGRAENPQRLERPWVGRLSTYLASFAGGMAVNDFSASSGYHGLAEAVALTAVVVAATWIRGLNPRARLPRHASWLFITPGACLAGIAAFISGPTSAVLTTVAALLTLAAVLVTKELVSAARLLHGVAFVAIGAGSITFGSEALDKGYALLGAATIAMGAGFAAYGVATIADNNWLIEAAKYALTIAGIPLVIAVTGDPSPHVGTTLSSGSKPLLMGAGIVAIVAGIAMCLPKIARSRALAAAAITALGAAYIAFGAAVLADTRNALMGTAMCALGGGCLVLGVALIGRRTITFRARLAVDWATKVPQRSEGQETGSATREGCDLDADCMA